MKYMYLFMLICASCSSVGENNIVSSSGYSFGGATNINNWVGDGVWVGQMYHDVLTFSDTNKFSYVGVDNCKSNGTFSIPHANLIQVNIINSTGGDCNSGPYICNFVIIDQTMDLTCAGNQLKYNLVVQ